MSNSVALVTADTIEIVVRTVRSKIQVHEHLINHFTNTRQMSRESAIERILTISARTALRLAKNDEAIASKALMIVGAKVNRLPQCTKLLRRHDSEVVALAYEMKDEISISDASLRMLCRFLEYTDLDIEGEVSKLRGLLEEVAMKAHSEKQEWYMHHRIEELLRQGHLIESIEDEILELIRNPFVPAGNETGGYDESD